MSKFNATRLAVVALALGAFVSSASAMTVYTGNDAAIARQIELTNGFAANPPVIPAVRTPSKASDAWLARSIGLENEFNARHQR